MTQVDRIQREEGQPEITAVKHEFRAAPQVGDLLASRPTARADVYAISILPGAADLTPIRYSAAIEKVRVIARKLHVDGWFTCDHTHYARVAHFRECEGEAK